MHAGAPANVQKESGLACFFCSHSLLTVASSTPSGQRGPGGATHWHSLLHLVLPSSAGASPVILTTAPVGDFLETGETTAPKISSMLAAGGGVAVGVGGGDV